jgi:hypothetical protein
MVMKANQANQHNQGVLSTRKLYGFPMRVSPLVGLVVGWLGPLNPFGKGSDSPTPTHPLPALLAWAGGAHFLTHANVPLLLATRVTPPLWPLAGSQARRKKGGIKMPSPLFGCPRPLRGTCGNPIFGVQAGRSRHLRKPFSRTINTTPHKADFVDNLMNNFVKLSPHKADFVDVDTFPHATPPIARGTTNQRANS